MSFPTQPIAVLAQACRLPGADTPEAFWRNLANGIESISEVPASRWPTDHLFAPPPYQPGKSVAKWGAFLDDIQRFDAAFFNIPAAEAQIMDPQQRILLELAHETLERAGYTAVRRQGLRIGVFLGIGQNGYSELTVPLLLSGQPTHPMLVANNIRNLIAGQIAHSLNLTGPALVVDTACSSSLVALHLARQSLLAGECELALVGGINLNITATPFVAFSSAGVLAPAAHTYVFDERAHGFVLGEGGGVLLLSTLSQATAASAPIIGLLRGSAINNDGHTLGTMTPSPTGQEAVLRAAYATAGLSPETITYIEAHATGTRIGDVVEARALTRCFPQPPVSGVRYLGAVKPNVGHLLSAAALPSLIKVLLAFQQRQLPPTLHSEQTRPIFKFAQAGFTVNHTLVDWLPAAPDLPLRAGVSSFGFGGTNAHVILEEAPALTPQAKPATAYAFAHTPFWIQQREGRRPLTENKKQQVGERGESREDATAVNRQPVSLPPSEPGIDEWLQRIGWAAAPFWAEPSGPRCTQWLVLAVDTAAAQTLAKQLSIHLQGQGFTCVYQPCQTGDEANLATWLTAQEAGWGLIFIGEIGPVQPLSNQTMLEASLARAAMPFHRFAQRLATAPAHQQPAGIWVVTAGAQRVDGDDEAIAPERAVLAGLAFALRDELPAMPCRVVDLAPSATVDRQLAQVAAELLTPSTHAVIAWRQQQGRWTRLVRGMYPQQAKPSTATPAILPKGVYLITGGASGIGAAVARSLAGLGMTLILTGRTPLTRDPQRAALVIELRKAGATVEYLVADITQAAEVAALFDYIGQLYGAPSGVIHAAGIVRPQPLRSKSQADLAAVLAPKVMGAWLLAQELERRAIQPACFVLFSSIAALLPGFAGGLSDYAAANAFLDALAATERKRGVACTAINWSIWTETGMGAQPALLHHLATQGVAGLTSAQGLSAFYRALRLGASQVIVCKPPSTIVNEAGLASVALAPRPVTAPLVTTREAEEIEQTLQRLLATVLKVAPADVSKTASFMNLGIDSMDALDLVQKLETIGFPGLPATLFFEYQTIADLAHYLTTYSAATGSQGATPPPADNTAPATAGYPLSPIQRAFAINHVLYPERPAVAFLRQTGQGVLQVALLQQAVHQISAHHPLLRTRFVFINDATAALAQTVCAPDDPTALPVLEIVTEVAGAPSLTHVEEHLINRPFDLAQGCPWRLLLLTDPQQPDQWHLLLAIHHIAGDAWSLSLVAHELWAIYTALTQGRVLDLPIPPSPLQAEPILQQPAQATLAWWRQQLADYAPALSQQVPFDQDPARLAPEEWAQTRYSVQATDLTAAQTVALTQLAADHQLSLFHLLLALYLRTLQQWCAATNLLVNVADAQRPPHQPGVMAMVGAFADTLPLGLALDPTEAVLALAERVRQRWLAIQPHKAASSLTLAHLAAEVAPLTATDQPRQLSPFGFSFARFDANPPADCPVAISAIFGRTATPTMRLSLVGWEFAGALHFSWNYVAPLFQAATIAALADRFSAEVNQLLRAQQPAIGVDDTALSGSEGDQVTPFIPVTALVQAQCQRTPAAVAVWENGDRLTYEELDQHSTQVARAIVAMSDAPTPVGLLASPSTAAIELLLGIAKAGAAWVPLDPAHPPARHADQLGQAGTQLLLFPRELAAEAEAIKAAMAGPLQLYALDELHHQPTTELCLPIVQSAQVAYIIFTSGSTGRPKGVPLTHGALSNYIGWAVETFGYAPTDRVMQATSLCFDASIRQILAPLVTGGTVVPIERSLLGDPQALLHFIQESRITVWSSVPALWGRLLGALENNRTADAPSTGLPDLRWIQVGGEVLAAQLMRRWFDLVGDQQRIANLYGPTETTINATYYIVPGRPAETETQIPIGYPVRGAHLQVCNERGELCPAGASGELWIGGRGLSPGYLADPQRTSARFSQTPTGERFYRSGDRVQQQADGALRFLGRLDEQVKVRGYRIELAEIEATLSQHPDVRLAAVITRQANPDEQMLVAYLECVSTPPTAETLRQWLHERLPAYMQPHHLYVTPTLPQMPNGKIDRQQLRSGAVEAAPLPRTSNGSAPQTATEQRLAEIWRTVLKLDTASVPLGREDDFFSLGGDSLQAIRVFVELGKTHPALPRATYLYRYRTLAALAAAIDAHQAAPTGQPPSVSTSNQFGVSLAQAGFLLMRAVQATQATSWCARFWLDGPLQAAAFEEAVQMLVERHAMLRTIFPAGDGRATRAPQQRIIQPDRPLPVGFTDLQARSAPAQQAALTAYWAQLQARQFEPTQWPLIELHLYRLTPTAHLWFVATDHLIGDGLSGWLLGQELLQLYDALVAGRRPALPPLRSSFRDYITLQQQQEAEPDPAAEQHWRQVFATPYQPPTRRDRERVHDAGWVHQSIELTTATVAQLESKATAVGVTLYELLLTLFFRQLQRLTGQRDLVVGSALTGRDLPLPDIMRIFGAFATALPLRLQLSEASWDEQVQQVAQAFQAARAYTLSPRRIAQLMHPQTPLTAALGAQFLFSYMDFTTVGSLHSDTLQVRWTASQTELQPPTLAADLLLSGRRLDGQLRLSFTASAAALNSAQVQDFVNHFAQALDELTAVRRSSAVVDGKQGGSPVPGSSVHFSNTPLDSGAITRLDTALIGYLPPLPQIQQTLGAIGLPLAANQVRHLLFPEQQPRWLEHLTTPLGDSGLLALPYFADELSAIPQAELHQAIQQAMQQATALGARCIALAGMLPAHTRYGYALLATEQNSAQPTLTTGHSTTVVAVVKTIQAALAATGQDLSTLAVGCLGVGSIGSAALQLLLQVGSHPSTLTLCDVVGSGERLRALAATLHQKFDYQGHVHIIEVDDHLPTELYTVDLLIGATSRPNLLNIAQLTPGTIVVDDSFPACLDVDQAIERMRRRQDILVTGGGLLHCGAIQRTLYLPTQNSTLAQLIAGQLHADAIASCQLEALLWSAHPGLPLTHGVATLAQAEQYWAAAEATGINAAPLHLRDFRIGEALLQQMKAICAARRPAATE